jgi:hypothetical protein
MGKEWVGVEGLADEFDVSKKTVYREPRKGPRERCCNRLQQLASPAEGALRPSGPWGVPTWPDCDPGRRVGQRKVVRDQA